MLNIDLDLQEKIKQQKQELGQIKPIDLTKLSAETVRYYEEKGKFAESCYQEGLRLEEANELKAAACCYLEASRCTHHAQAEEKLASEKFNKVLQEEGLELEETENAFIITEGIIYLAQYYFKLDSEMRTPYFDEVRTKHLDQFENLKSMAREGDAKAQYTLALIFKKLFTEGGHDPNMPLSFNENESQKESIQVATDYREMITYFRFAALQGNQDAKKELNNIYELDHVDSDGRHRSSIYKHAIKYRFLPFSAEEARWLRKDYQQGIVYALHHLETLKKEFNYVEYHYNMALGKEITDEEIETNLSFTCFTDMVISDTFLTDKKRREYLQKAESLLQKKKVQHHPRTEKEQHALYLLANYHYDHRSDYEDAQEGSVQTHLQQIVNLYQEIPNTSPDYPAAQKDLSDILFLLDLEGSDWMIARYRWAKTVKDDDIDIDFARIFLNSVEGFIGEVGNRLSEGNLTNQDLMELTALFKKFSQNDTCNPKNTLEGLEKALEMCKREGYKLYADIEGSKSSSIDSLFYSTGSSYLFWKKITNGSEKEAPPQEFLSKTLEYKSY
jgi:TPR repeat protein